MLGDNEALVFCYKETTYYTLSRTHRLAKFSAVEYKDSSWNVQVAFVTNVYMRNKFRHHIGLISTEVGAFCRIPGHATVQLYEQRISLTNSFWSAVPLHCYIEVNH